ncbi:hypothetical protein EB001_11240 [bacterium]|nr:hypothetical protein [bacterium]
MIVLPDHSGLDFMDTVSQKYFIRLDKQISCDLICSQVQNLVTKFQKSFPDVSDSFISLEIKKVNHSVDNILLLEHHSPT